MISFSEYVQLNQNKAFNHQPVAVPEVKVKKIVSQIIAPAPVKEKDVYDYMKEANPKVWTAKIVKDQKYLIYNEHYLNVSILAKTLKDLYNQNGYENYGFSKLDESDLIRYTTVRDILSREFMNPTATTELEPSSVAQTIFENELKDFEWKPQPLILK
ncbi:MAG: hypothetical protein J6T10_04045 [Methanobrevibacter sp.]|nr:hypothetical protein [Methanobrevibacter sp.]